MILEKFVKIWKKEELSATELETKGAFFRWLSVERRAQRVFFRQRRWGEPCFLVNGSFSWTPGRLNGRAQFNQARGGRLNLNGGEATPPDPFNRQFNCNSFFRQRGLFVELSSSTGSSRKNAP